MLRDLGDLKQAKEYFERALAIQLEKLGPHHVNVAISYDNLLGNVLAEPSRPPELGKGVS